jgi:hypothetical protein
MPQSKRAAQAESNKSRVAIGPDSRGTSHTLSETEEESPTNPAQTLPAVHRQEVRCVVVEPTVLFQGRSRHAVKEQA